MPIKTIVDFAVHLVYLNMFYIISVEAMAVIGAFFVLSSYPEQFSVHFVLNYAITGDKPTAVGGPLDSAHLNSAHPNSAQLISAQGVAVDGIDAYVGIRARELTIRRISKQVSK